MGVFVDVAQVAQNLGYTAYPIFSIMHTIISKGTKSVKVSAQARRDCNDQQPADPATAKK